MGVRTLIEKLKIGDTIEYVDGEIYSKYIDDEPLFNEQETRSLITEYYEGRTVNLGDGSGNPEKDYDKNVTGKQYLEYHFNSIFGIDYKKAYEAI